MSLDADVVIIGGGIVGCAAAAFLTEAGAKVELYERDEVGAAASGRNSGSVQHPFDPVLTELHVETLEHYRGLNGLDLPSEPAGVLMLSSEREAIAPAVDEIGRDCPELEPALLDPAELRAVEPGVADGLWACRLETGYPVRPVAARWALRPRKWNATWPLSSAAPRSSSSPSRRAGIHPPGTARKRSDAAAPQWGWGV